MSIFCNYALASSTPLTSSKVTVFSLPLVNEDYECKSIAYAITYCLEECHHPYHPCHHQAYDPFYHGRSIGGRLGGHFDSIRSTIPIADDDIESDNARAKILESTS
jgi:hypothetical protein